MKLFVTLLCAVALASRTFADDAKIKQAVEKGVVTGEFIKTLTPDDVPDKWKAQVEVKDTEDRVTKTYSREGTKALQVLWAKNWTGDKEKMFVATIYHGDVRLCKIVHIGSSTGIMTTDVPKGYQLMLRGEDESLTMGWVG